VLPLAIAFVPADAAYVAPSGARFNVPKPWGNDTESYRLVRTVTTAIQNTRPTKKVPHPEIHISTYLMDHSPTVDAMIAACRRGVQVRVILDEDIDNWNSRRLITALNADNTRDKDGDGKGDTEPRAGACNGPIKGTQQSRTNPDADGGTIPLMTPRQARRSVQVPTGDSDTWGVDGSFVKKCNGSCRGAGGNMHSKFYLFERTGKSRKVVMVSSSNINHGGARLGWNDMYVMKNRPKSYRGYKQMHRAMSEDIRANNKKVEIKDGPFTSRFFPMKNASKANDPTLQDLNKIRCTSGLGRTQIHVSMFYWKGTRGNYITDKLLSLARAGCAVNVIYGAPSVQMATRLRAAARSGLINLYDSRWDHNDDGWNEVRTHAKYVLVKGTVGDDRTAWQVWTGTQNWVAGSLRKGDENSLNIDLKSAYTAYLRDWNMIRAHSRRLPYS
jgi:phosphatidylserine/phosphatidylglycerophosphate/cardiolipin synthase-like enzyme